MYKVLGEIFSADGPLVKALKGYETRPEQQEMSHQILQAYLNKGLALIEAGTGTGKSLAYLIPAILWAMVHKEKSVISTYTIALQEQLLNKDIPLLAKVLEMDFKAVIVKGMNNYLCLRKLEEDPSEELLELRQWSENAQEGSYSEIEFPVAVSKWQRVSADAQSCTHQHCPHYKKCFFFKARKEAEDAQLLVVNHHILFADKISKERKDFREEKAILPPYRRLVIDEAHHLEEVALSSLSKRCDKLGLIKTLQSLSSERQREQALFLQIALALSKDKASLLSRLENELPAEKRRVLDALEEAFCALEAFCRSTFFSREPKWRFREEHFRLPLLETQVVPLFHALKEALLSFVQGLQSLKEEIDKKFPQYSMRIQAVITYLEEQAEGVVNFFQQDATCQRVRWVEANSLGNNLTLIDAQLDISAYLKEHFFDCLDTQILCSATLSCGGDFTHMRERLGVDQTLSVVENSYASPFDYASHALLAIPTDLVDPSHPHFTQEVVQLISQVICLSQGRAFILFTSYEMLKTVYEQLLPLAEQEGFSFLKQGEGSRKLLIESFIQKEKSVLFGTDSFWEGVDITGNRLKLVILVKIPFKVPTDPFTQALCETLEAEGKNSFMDYLVPQAVMKFKQGFGRLIRTKRDKGVILCLDKRLVTKSYGNLFLKSLPTCKTSFGRREEIFRDMIDMLKI